MRLLRISAAYPTYLGQFYAQRPELAAKSYAEQHASLMADCYHWANFMSSALCQLGYEADDIVANAKPMQEAWARECGLRYSEETWLTDITLAQIIEFRPEVLFMFDWSKPFGAEFIQCCREALPSLKLVLGWCGEAHPPATYFRNHDLVLSCAPDTVSDLKSQGVRALHLNHAFSPAILRQLKLPTSQNNTVIPVGFAGQVVYGKNFHNARAHLLDAISRKDDLVICGQVEDLGSEQSSPIYKRFLRQTYYTGLNSLNALGMGWIAEQLPRYEWSIEAQNRPVFTRLRKLARDSLFGIEMYRQLQRFSVCLNTHGPSRFASNMRLYEATGVGTCLLTDWKRNLPDLFEPDREVVTYRSSEECVDKCRYLLNHDRERQVISAAGQARTLRDHTFVQRAAQLDEIIHKALARPDSR